MPTSLEIVGSGPLESQLRFQVKALGIENFVEFSGTIPWGPPLQSRYCAADLFVLPSISEGMPRVVLEAMACALPVVSTNTGGVKEILFDEDMVPPGNIEALSCKLQEVICDPLRLEAMSRRNFEIVQQFRLDVLRSGKQSFYKRLAGNN
jgi:glycosyltransferase involved in cell wall biosynthesis